MPTIEKQLMTLPLDLVKPLRNLKTIENSHIEQSNLIDKKLEELTRGFTK